MLKNDEKKMRYYLRKIIKDYEDQIERLQCNADYLYDQSAMSRVKYIQFKLASIFSLAKKAGVNLYPHK